MPAFRFSGWRACEIWWTAMVRRSARRLRAPGFFGRRDDAGGAEKVCCVRIAGDGVGDGDIVGDLDHRRRLRTTAELDRRGPRLVDAAPAARLRPVGFAVRLRGERRAYPAPLGRHPTC